MKKKINILFIILILVISIIPLLFVNKKEGAISESENRQLASFPKLYNSEGKYNKKFNVEFTSWLNDNIGFRENMLQINTRFLYKVFEKIDSEDVILGKEDWLFYQGEKGLAISDYQIKNLYSESQLQQILANVKEMQQWCYENDMEFVLMVIPNKEYVYEEYLPDGIVANSEEKNIDYVVEYIRENSDIKVAYPKEALLSMKQKYPVYYKYDTHWNEIGGYIGYVSLMECLGKEAMPLDTWDVIHADKDGGDLAGIAKLKGLLPTYQEPKVIFEDEVSLVYDDQQGNNSYQKYEYVGGDGKIFIMGDSFRTAMKPYISRQYQYSSYVHRGRNLFQEVLNEKPDVFVYQLVERYVPLLKNPIDMTSSVSK